MSPAGDEITGIVSLAEMILCRVTICVNHVLKGCDFYLDVAGLRLWGRSVEYLREMQYLYK